MSNKNDPYRHLSNNYTTPLLVHEPLIPLAEMVARIERIRASEGMDSRLLPLGLAPYRRGRDLDIDEQVAS